jgi:hypothetical protein
MKLHKQNLGYLDDGEARSHGLTILWNHRQNFFDIIWSQESAVGIRS